ncbi:MAG TPA: TolC family protein [Cyclobacteriaceae bacterium]|nr:TolC family protein [Cyclobacteriaceae bacterium]
MKAMKLKVSSWILGALFIAPQLGWAQDAQLNLDSCYAMAKRNYPLTKQFGLIEKSKEYSISNANKAYLPQISVTAIGAYLDGIPSIPFPGSEEPSKTQFIGIAQLNQTIWDGGATKAQKNVIKASAEVEKANVEMNLQSLRERLNQVYFGILVIDEQVKQLDILTQNLQRNLNKIQITKDNGYAFQSDVDEVKAEVLNADQKKIEFRYTRKGYVDMLSHLIGQPLNENVQLSRPGGIETYSTFTNNRAELRYYSNQRNLIEAKSSFNNVGNMPKIGLMGIGMMMQPGISFGPTTFDHITLLGASLSWSTANLYKTSNNKQLDKIQSGVISNQQETFEFNNNLQLKQTTAEIEKHQAVLNKDNEIVALKEGITKSYQLKYDNGLASMNDLLTSMNRESEAKNNQALHSIQLLLSIYNYKTISGN